METDEENVSVLVQMCSEDGEITGPQMDVPLCITTNQLQLLCNSLLQNVCSIRVARVT